MADPTHSARPLGLPSLAELVEHPERATVLPPDVARQLFVRVAALQAALSTALLPPPDAQPARGERGDRLLGPGEVAERIGKSRSWVEKNPDELPARRRVGREGLWSERELEAWIRSRPRWGDD